MKILVLYRYSKTNSFNHWGNLDFYKNLNKIDNVEVMIYGPQVEDICPSLTLTQFNSDLYMKNIYEKYNFDIIIIAGKNRTYYESNEQKSWLPLDFATFPCYKILIEPDFHKYKEDSWFYQNDIGLILHRHKSNVIRAEEYLSEIKHIWFPYSVDEKIFKFGRRKRINGISFIGNSKARAYIIRQKAIEILKENDLLKFQGLKYETEYLEILKKYTIFLNGASIYNIDNMKAFEILASGGILLTNNASNEFKTLFKKAYIVYKNDFSDIIKITKKLLNNSKMQNKIRKMGRKIICKRHTHKIRSKELFKIIKSELRLHKNDYIKNKIDIPKILEPIVNDTVEPIVNDIESAIEMNKHQSILSELDESTQIYLDLIKLQENNIKVCLLKKTCYEKVIGSPLTYPLYLGVSDIQQANMILPHKVFFKNIPNKMKKTKMNDIIVKVPFPVISYLKNEGYTNIK